MNSMMSSDLVNMLDSINKSQSIEDAVKIVKQIDALKTALESVEMFRSQSVMYARLEAEALIKVVDLGGLNKLRGAHRATANWLAELDYNTREKYISMCLEGLTIDQVYKREVGAPREKLRQIEELKTMREELIAELTTTGMTDITPYANHARRVFWDDLSTARDLVDGTRNRLRQAGGIGIGDETGVYVIPTKGNQDAIKEAILLRFEGVRADLNNIKEITKASKVKMNCKDFLTGKSWELENDPAFAHILLWLNTIGLVDDAVYDKITKADFRREMDHVSRTLKLNRELYIKSLYKGLTRTDPDPTT